MKNNSKKKALITGITGFAGSHLAEHLLKKDYEVYGTIRHRSRTDNIDHIRDKINLGELDLRDPHNTLIYIKKIDPDYIFHLAGQSLVPTSWIAPTETLTINAIGTVNLLEAVRQCKSDPVVQIAGSSEEYGLVYAHELPVKEDNPLRPLSPYGVSKIIQDMLGFQYFKSYGIKTIVTRAFNHEGPRRGEPFVTSNFAKQIAEIEINKKDPVIYVGNLEAERDFTDVIDIIKAYELAVLKGDPGEVYNICSGNALKIREVLDILLNMSNIKVSVKQDPSRMRPSDVPLLRGDCTKFKEKTGWEPEIEFNQTMKDLLDYWRERVKRNYI